jgi:hypothetical protein
MGVSSNMLRTTKSSGFALSWTLGAALVLGGVGTSASAAVISARSGLATDIQAAVNLAKTGDTVTIPAGTFHFTGQVFAPAFTSRGPAGTAPTSLRATI